MEIGKTSNLYMMLMYVYLKSYEEAIKDFECAVKDAGYADIALMAVRQKFSEKIDKVAGAVSS
jgi:hypothetical protein